MQTLVFLKVAMHMGDELSNDSKEGAWYFTVQTSTFVAE